MVQPVAHFLPALLPLFLLAACSSTSESSESGPPGTATSYEAWCDAQAAPSCASLGPGYGATCTLIFGAQRKKVKPECVAKFDALMQCSASMTYACDANGRLVSAPQGACARAANDCDVCNGNQSCTLSGLLGP